MANLTKPEIAELAELILVSEIVPVEKKFEWINVVPNLSAEKAAELKKLLKKEQGLHEGDFVNLTNSEAEMIKKYSENKKRETRNIKIEVVHRREGRSKEGEQEEIKRILVQMDKIFKK